MQKKNPCPEIGDTPIPDPPPARSLRALAVLLGSMSALSDFLPPCLWRGRHAMAYCRLYYSAIPCPDPPHARSLRSLAYYFRRHWNICHFQRRSVNIMMHIIVLPLAIWRKSYYSNISPKCIRKCFVGLQMQRFPCLEIGDTPIPDPRSAPGFQVRSLRCFIPPPPEILLVTGLQVYAKIANCYRTVT